MLAQESPSHDRRTAHDVYRARLEALRADRLTLLGGVVDGVGVALAAAHRGVHSDEVAGVSVEMVYKGFDNKPDLVRQILGAAVAGDDEPIALVDRPAMQAAHHARSGAQIVAAFADLSTDILVRIGPLLATLLVAGRAGEPELREIAHTANEQRLADIRRIIDAVYATGDLHPALDPARAADILWTIGSPEVHQQLTADRGWSNEDYSSWLTATLQAVLLR
jgi:hypothetical protein